MSRGKIGLGVPIVLFAFGLLSWFAQSTFAFFSPASLAPSAWPMFRGNAHHTGESAVNGPASNHVRWVYTASNFLSSSPAVGVDGTLYIGSWDNNLYAVNPNGSTKWKFPTNSYISSSPAIDSDGVIYFGSWDHNVYAVNPNGTLKWVYPTKDIVTSSPAIGPDGTVYVGSWDYSVYALTAPSSGITATLKWKYLTGNYVSSSPAVSGTTVYVGSWDSKLYALTAPGSGVTATVVFSYTTGDSISGSPTLGSDGTIYFGSWDKNLYALNPNGTLKWTFAAPGNIRSTPAVGSSGTIFVGSSYEGVLGDEEAVYAINSSGSQIWRKQLGFSIDPGGDEGVSTPILGADGTVYLGATDVTPMGTVYGLNPSNGNTLWSYTTGNSVTSSPALGADGTLYIGSYDNGLYAIGTSITFTPTNFVDLPFIQR